jgi:hypothetical protein
MVFFDRYPVYPANDLLVNVSCGILYILIIMLRIMDSGFEFLRVSVSPWWTAFPACRGILATKNPLRQGPERVVKSACGCQGTDGVGRRTCPGDLRRFAQTTVREGMAT